MNDGLSNPRQYVKEQFQRIFKNNEYEIFDDVWESKWLKDKLDLNDLSKTDARELFKEFVNSLDDDLFDFIKIE